MGKIKDLLAVAKEEQPGITVLIADKVISELESAAGKVEDGELAPDDGAPHNE